MFVASVPYGIFNKTSQTTIYLKKSKEEKTHTHKRPFICTNFFNKKFHREPERIITIK